MSSKMCYTSDVATLRTSSVLLRTRTGSRQRAAEFLLKASTETWADMRAATC